METLDQPLTGSPVMGVKDWLITLIITAIPLVGLIMLFVWAFSDGNNPNKQNFAKAVLLLYLIIIVLYILLFVIFGAAFLAGLGS